ncbi:cysteine-rich venom protein 1-like [Microplitis mediator]|uniref:cysteine-rich venom protein 1-like n=1 Tax=Microplitis mediator TaxID=375433 RepID=UPI002554A286|nr:cysteine-rich venom protein 1-like [Microplitis mediator]
MYRVVASFLFAFFVIEVLTCSKNETMSLCGKMCLPTCENPHPNTKFCPHTQCTNLTAACRCKTGYVLDTKCTQKCILQCDCPKTT